MDSWDYSQSPFDLNSTEHYSHNILVMDSLGLWLREAQKSLQKRYKSNEHKQNSQNKRMFDLFATVFFLLEKKNQNLLRRIVDLVRIFYSREMVNFPRALKRKLTHNMTNVYVSKINQELKLPLFKKQHIYWHLNFIADVYLNRVRG